jgi:hypothetical protein
MWKEAVRPNFRQHPGICLVGLRNTTQNITTVCVLAEVRIGHILNTSQGCY